MELTKEQMENLKSFLLETFDLKWFSAVFHEKKKFERRQHSTWERVAVSSPRRSRAVHSGLCRLQQNILDMTDL